VAPSTTVVEELLAREGELTQKEEAFVAREEKARTSKKALVQVSAALDAERTKAKAARQEYLDKIEAHITRNKHVLILNKMLGEKRVELDERERDLELRTVALAEAQAQGLNPRDEPPG
jgi:hypothetical protein